MVLDEETLEGTAQDGHMNYEKWPPIVEPLLQRINHIAYHEFTTPTPYPVINYIRQPFSPSLRYDQASNQELQDPPASQNGGLDVPATPASSRNIPPVPLFPSDTQSSPPTSQIADSLPPSTHPDQPALPAPLLQLLNGIIHTISTTFSTLPPHTVQRLSELVLDPKRHYRNLPAWLRALDRTVSVTSTADIFPLPKALPLPSHVIDSSFLTNGLHTDTDSMEEGNNGALGAGGGGILWINNAEADRDGNIFDIDESLGGALLTPIPWLKNGTVSSRTEDSSGTQSSAETGSEEEMGGFESPVDSSGSVSPTSPRSTPAIAIANPVSHPLVPEREDGAVTQGELIRQEQEAGVVPVGHSDADSRGMILDPEEEDGDDERDELEDTTDREPATEMPHARGPGVLGAVDVGKVDGKDVELNLSTGNRDPSRDSRQVRNAQDVLLGGDNQEPISTDAMEVDTSLQSDEAEVENADGTGQLDELPVSAGMES